MKMISDIHGSIKLEDDNTPYGGTAFDGETLYDFLQEANKLDLLESNNIKAINDLLIDNGIKPIK